jgi:hypothetical protein
VIEVLVVLVVLALVLVLVLVLVLAQPGLNRMRAIMMGCMAEAGLRG